MTDDDRYRLLFGPYKTPRFRYGSTRFCELRGDLARAVRRESAQAVAHWWGITPQTVTKWRQALDVGPTNEGMRRLHHDYWEEPWALEARAKAVAKTGDPVRRAKIAAAKRGKPRPAHRNSRNGAAPAGNLCHRGRGRVSQEEW